MDQSLVDELRELGVRGFYVRVNRSDSPSPKKVRRTRPPTEGDRVPTGAEKACIICEERRAWCVAVPCGHCYFCAECSQKIEDICPVCKTEIEQIIRVYT
jgi:hypothetical protein